jgi:hypothetical protein
MTEDNVEETNYIRVAEDNLEYSHLLVWRGKRTLHKSRKLDAKLSEHQILSEILVYGTNY